MSPAIYQRFRPALKAFLRRRQGRDLQAELGAAIEERNDLRRSRDWWRDYAIEAAGHSLEQTEALRAALIAMLRNDDWCQDAAWHALGFEGHFDPTLLPLVRP